WRSWSGSAGYIGSDMVHALLDVGERVVVLDNLATGFDWAVAQGALLVIGDAGGQLGRANIAPAGFLFTRIFRRYIDHRRPSIGLDDAVILQGFQQRRLDLLGRHRLELARRRVANRGFFLFSSFNLVLL